VTKFVPTAVKIHRNPNKPRGKPTPAAGNVQQQQQPVDPISSHSAKRKKVEPTKDDIYANFMNEMDGFL